VGAPFNVGVVAVVMLSVAFTSWSRARDSGHVDRKTEGKAVSAGGTLAASNLQVLPKDTPYAELVMLMTRYSQEIGVQCVFCHTQNPQTQQVDFASDESPAKLAARVMIGMVRDINGKYLAQVSDRRYAVPISCGNCHQGQTFPPAFEARPAP
jgi:Photosynthetic reaction centre cytochrome C subunit